MTPPNKRQSLPPLPPFSPIPPAFVRRTRVFLFVENQSVVMPPKLFLKIYKKK